jgi:hypothetical protein
MSLVNSSPLYLHSTRHLHAPASATQRSPAVSLREVITSARMRGCGDRKQHDGVTGDGLLWNVRSGEWNLPTVQQSALVTGGRRNGVQCFDGFLHCLALAVLQPLQTPQNRISGFLVRCKLLVCQSLDEPFRQSHMLENIPKIEGRFPRHTATTSDSMISFNSGLMSSRGTRSTFIPRSSESMTCAPARSRSEAFSSNSANKSRSLFSRCSHECRTRTCPRPAPCSVGVARLREHKSLRVFLRVSS